VRRVIHARRTWIHPAYVATNNFGGQIRDCLVHFTKVSLCHSVFVIEGIVMRKLAAARLGRVHHAV